MNKTCKEIQNELIHSGTKISQSDFLKICEKYNLSLIEVDELSKSISDLQLYLNDDTESADEDIMIMVYVDSFHMVIPPILEMFISGLKSYSILMTSCKQTYQTSGKKTITHMRL